MFDDCRYGDEDLFDLNHDGAVDDIELSMMLDEQDRECERLFGNNGHFESASDDLDLDSECNDEDSFDDAVETEQPMESDYPTRRAYDAACLLASMDEDPDYYSDEDSLHQREICELILEGKELPFRYLTLYQGFLVAQAVKEQFDLPCTLPDEDQEPKTSPSDLLKRIARRNVPLAIEVWAWCADEFTPYIMYSPDADIVHNDVLFALSDYPKSFLPELINYFEENEEFVVSLFRENPEDPYDAYIIVATALEQGKIEVAKKVFLAYLNNPNLEASNIEDFVDSCIDCCNNWDELEAIEAFKTSLYPLLKDYCCEEIHALFPEWEKTMQEHIDDVERSSEKYAFSRRNDWRMKYKDSNDNGLDVCDYDSEKDYIAAAEKKKYEWRSWCKYEAERYHIPLENFETEEQFEKKKQRIIEEERQQCLLQREQVRKERLEAQRNRMDPLAQTDQTVYRFCLVVLSLPAARPCWYLSGDIDVEIGDSVIVPYRNGKWEIEGTIVSVGKFLRMAAPYPVDRARSIIKKVNK